MYKIESQPWGFQITFIGKICASEMHKWYEDSKTILDSPNLKTPFVVLVDMIKMEPICSEAGMILAQGQSYYLAKGMLRSVVVFDSHAQILRVNKISEKTGIAPTERYVSTKAYTEWKEAAMRWLIEGREP